MNNRPIALWSVQTPEEARHDHATFHAAAHEAYGFWRTLWHEARELWGDVFGRKRR